MLIALIISTIIFIILFVVWRSEKKKGVTVQQPAVQELTVPGVANLQGDDERQMGKNGKSGLGGEDEQLSRISCYNDLYDLVVVRHDWRTFAKVANRATALGYWGEELSRRDRPVHDALKNGGTEVIDLLIQELDRFSGFGADQIAEVLADLGGDRVFRGGWIDIPGPYSAKAASAIKRSIARGDFIGSTTSRVDDFLTANRSTEEIIQDNSAKLEQAERRKRAQKMAEEVVRNGQAVNRVAHLVGYLRQFQDNPTLLHEKPEYDELRQIGQALFEVGGLDLMQKTAYAMATLVTAPVNPYLIDQGRNSVSDINVYWSGIGDWRL